MAEMDETLDLAAPPAPPDQGAAVAAERERLLAIVDAVLLGHPVPFSLTTACADIRQRANA